MAKKPLRTRWGGKRATYPPIITSPPSRKTNLALTSIVLVRGFWSLRQHEYQYIAENSSSANFRVDWIGPKVVWGSLPPEKVIQRRYSFCSPSEIEGSVDADVFAGTGVRDYRRVRGEVARAYVPWQDGAWKNLWETIKGIKSVLEIGVPIFTFGSIEASSGILGVLSWVRKIKSQFVYRLEIINSTPVALACEVPGIISGLEKVAVELGSGETRAWAVDSQDTPGETPMLVRFTNPEQGHTASSSFPLGVLAPFSFAKDWRTADIELVESTR